MIAAPLLLLAMLLQQPAAVREAPANLDMERADASGAPAGWDVVPMLPHPAFEIGSVPGENGGRAARIVRRSPAPPRSPDFASLGQAIDAAPYRGRLVRLSARIRAVRPGAHAGLGLRVMRPPPKSAGLFDQMTDRPITANEWRRYEIVGRVAPDATVVAFTVNAVGDAELLVDDVALEIVEPNPAPPAPEAAAYLESAIALLREHHIDSGTADWNRIAADARAEIGDARTPADTYPAIRGVIGALGEKHTFLRPAQPPAVPGPGGRPRAPAPPRPAPMPRFKLIDGRFGAVRMPAFSGSPEGARLYTDTLRRSLQLLGDGGVCGWIVDLRGNSGGNMWPMLSGLDPLLGPAPFGSFVTPGGGVQHWVRAQGAVVPAAAAASTAPAFALRGAARPVAVLFDASTTSSGEMVAVSLIGRNGVRTFGAPSGAFTTANRGYPLSDGAMLVVTGAFIRDRQGRDYRDAIAPDEPTEDPVGAAVRWLSTQPCAA